MSAANLVTKVLLAAFDELALTTPTMFLQNFFGKNPSELSLSENEKVEIDVIRNFNLIAFDVVRGGSDGNQNKVERFTTKEYAPPLYDEVTAITASMLNKRSPGVNTYGLTDAQANFLRLAVKAQTKQADKIKRSIESQASGALFSGAITLVNTESLDFKRKATHNITPGVQWTEAAGQPITDLITACEVNLEDGKMKSNTAIFGATAWVTFLSNVNVKNYLDNRRIDPGVIRPTVAPENATFQGVIWVGDYQLEIFTYPEFFEDALGNTTKFVPEKQVCVMNSQARLDKVFAAVELLPEFERQYDNFGIPTIPTLQRGQFRPYAYTKPPKSLYVGVQSAPLVVPTQIDTISNINAVA